MSFKTVIMAFVAFVKAIFGGNKSSEKPVETPAETPKEIVIDKSKCMKEAVIQFLVQGHPIEEQGEIRDLIKEKEAAGIYEYTFETSRWVVKVKDGQFSTSTK